MSELNRKLHEARGLCWHQWPLDAADMPTLPCSTCGAETVMWPAPNPSYTDSLPDAFELVEWMRKERLASFDMFCDYSGSWEVQIGLPSNDFTTMYESLPTAISLACAKALGIEP